MHAYIYIYIHDDEKWFLTFAVSTVAVRLRTHRLVLPVTAHIETFLGCLSVYMYIYICVGVYVYMLFLVYHGFVVSLCPGIVLDLNMLGGAFIYIVFCLFCKCSIGDCDHTYLCKKKKGIYL